MEHKKRKIRKSWYCICGDRAQAYGSQKVVDATGQVFFTVHSGEGHGACNKQTSDKAYRKQGRE